MSVPESGATDNSMKRRVIVAITGASGACYGMRLLERLRAMPGLEIHLVVSSAGWLNITHELGSERASLGCLADKVYDPREIGASIASGSFHTTAMAIVPCSMKTLAAIAHGFSDNLITRAADVTLKERRRLLLMVRETPFNLAHLRNMTKVTEMGGIIFPPMPAFYHAPSSMKALIDHTVGHAIDLLELCPGASQRPEWRGLRAERRP